MEFRRIRLERLAPDGAVEFGVVEASGRDVSVTRGRGDEPGVRTTRQAISDQWVAEMFGKAVQRLRGEGYADPRATQPVDATASPASAPPELAARPIAVGSGLCQGSAATTDGSGELTESETTRESASSADAASELLFAAGRAAQDRGWQQVTIITTADIGTCAPGGEPLIVLAGSDMHVEDARALAALNGAGRPVLLVTDRAVSAEVSAWMPLGCVVVTDSATTPAIRKRSGATGESTRSPTTPEEPTPGYALTDTTSSFPGAEQPRSLPTEHGSAIRTTQSASQRDLSLQALSATARRLVTNTDLAARIRLGERNQSPDMLRALATDSSPLVRAAVAGNFRCPPEIIGTLAMDADPDVRWAAIDNHNCPQEMLRALLTEADAEARARLLTLEPAAPEAILRSLAQDENDVLAATAALLLAGYPAGQWVYALGFLTSPSLTDLAGALRSVLNGTAGCTRPDPSVLQAIHEHASAAALTTIKRLAPDR